MYCIAVYDIKERRVVKMLKLLRRYLHHRQRSVFEGHLSEGKYMELIERAKDIMNERHDSLIIYRMETNEHLKCDIIGTPPYKGDGVFL